MLRGRRDLTVAASVIPEAAWLIETRLGPAVEARFLTLVTSARFTIVDLTAIDYQRTIALIGAYASLGLGFVDASIIAVAEGHNVDTIATLNHRDFAVVKPAIATRSHSSPDARHTTAGLSWSARLNEMNTPATVDDNRVRDRVDSRVAGNTRPRVSAPQHPVGRRSRPGRMARRCRSTVAAVTTWAPVRVGCSVFLNNRYHDPTTGIFISVDPLVASTGDPYLYSSGNPASFSGPTGLLDISDLSNIHNETCDNSPCNPGTGISGGTGSGGTGGNGSTTKTVERLLETGTAPLNSWFDTCARSYQQCLDGSINPTGHESGDGSAQAADNFSLAMMLLGEAVAGGAAVFDPSTGWLIGGDGYLFLLYAMNIEGALFVGDKRGEFPTPEPSGWTLGISSGFCIFFCLEIGLSGAGPYVRPGVGVAIDSPGIVVSNEDPDCGTEESLAYVAVGVGPVQFSGGAVSPGRSGDWSGYGPQFTGFNLPDGGSTPSYKVFSAGAGVVHNWTFC